MRLCCCCCDDDVMPLASLQAQILSWTDLITASYNNVSARVDTLASLVAQTLAVQLSNNQILNSTSSAMQVGGLGWEGTAGRVQCRP